MDWSRVAQNVAGFAPLVGTALGGPLGGAAGSLVASLFGVEAEPDAVARAIAADPEASVKLKELEVRQRLELERMVLTAETRQLEAINATMRAEAMSGDKYVARWRPTFGYMMAGTWALQMAGVTYVVVAEPLYAAELIKAIGDLSVIWGVALAVLGINVAKRSQDKAVAAGAPPPATLMGAVADRIRGRE